MMEDITSLLRIIRRLQPDTFYKRAFRASPFGSLIRVLRYCVARIHSPRAPSGGLPFDRKTRCGVFFLSISPA
ncbi:predicted protein [Brucella sp. 83/13]|nr:predicted protein [Brucella sp. 83/13]